MKYANTCQSNRSLAGAGVGTLLMGFPFGTAGGALVGNVTCKTQKKGIVKKVIGSAKSVITPSTYIK